jgi:hypothetical protein
MAIASSPPAIPGPLFEVDHATRMVALRKTGIVQSCSEPPAPRSPRSEDGPEPIRDR